MNSRDLAAFGSFYDCLERIEDTVGNPRFTEELGRFEQVCIRDSFLKQLNTYADAALPIDTSAFLDRQRWIELVERMREVFRAVLEPNMLGRWEILDRMQSALAEMRPYRILANNAVKARAAGQTGDGSHAPAPPDTASGPASPAADGATEAAGDDVPWPEYMTATDLADRLSLPREATRKKLERLAERIDCRREVESPRRGEARWTYRTQTVLPELRQ